MKKEKEINKLIIDPETGEVTNQLYYGDNILRGETLQYLDETVEVGKNEYFVKIFESTLVDLGDESLTGKQWKVLITLIKHFKYKSGLVSYKNGNPLYIENISKLSAIPERTTYEAIEKLILKKIIAKNRTGTEIQYYMNPFIFCKGTRINKTLYSMFQNSKWATLHKNTVIEQ
jgi:hypothetical protein